MASAASPLGRRECVVPTVQCCVKLNTAIEHGFQRLGWFVASYPIPILIINVLVLIGLCFGLFSFELETNIFDLWAPTDSPIWDENEFIDEYWSDTEYGLVVWAAYAKTGYTTNILETKYIQEWFELHLDFMVNLPKRNFTYEDDNGETQTITFGYYMEDYYDIESLDELANKSGEIVPHYNSKIVPLCRNFATSPLEAQFQLPCYMLNVMDCFTEGGYFFPYENYLAKTVLGDVYPTNPFLEKPSFQDLTGLELGAVLAPSCEAWQGTVIPSNYIYGGETRTDPDDETSQITELNSFETIAFVDSPYGIARKIKIASQNCTYTDFYSISCPTPSDKEKEVAEEFLYKWLSDYIDFMEDKAKEYHNDDSKLFELVFWTPRTSGDLLTEASQANFGLLILAYAAMIVFAAIVSFRPRDLFLSKTEASCSGVLLVLLAVVATMGTGALFVKFSPNVIQVLPFIALGFGVDDMFVLLFSFRFRENSTIKDMIGEAVRLAGSSVAMTSTSNFFAFLVGSFMVLPDVARFATFGMIIVVLNFFTVLFGFTAILAFTAQRMAARHNDCSFLCCFAEFTKAKKTKSERHNQAHGFDPFFDFMANDYTRIFGLLGFFALAGLGIYGCSMARLGLPLADIVPEGTYASDFLKVRTKFYFTYVVSLYTDADGKNLKRMDWSSKFETWINATDDIFSMSSLVYEDENVHDFWAWNMRDYLSDIYEGTFDPFELQTLVNDDNYTSKSPECESDRINSCPGVLANYSVNSDLYNCLIYNYDVLTSANCQSYLDSLVIETNNTMTIARQVELIISGNDTLEGLYVAPNDNEINVYYKLNGNGLLYQDSDGTWIVLNENYEAVYFGPATELDSTQPPQYGWEDTYGKLQAMTTVYWDSNNTDYYRSSDVFITYDIEEVTSFVLNYSFITGLQESNIGSCYLYDALKISMQDTTNFDNILFASSDGYNNNNSLTCSAHIESTNICNAIANEETITSTVCGEFIESEYISSIESTTWMTNTNCNNGYTLAAATDETNITYAESCMCSDDTSSFNFNDNGASSSITYGFLSPCAYEEDSQYWGGFGINDESTSCSSIDQTISVTCNADTCDSVDSCLYDFSRLVLAGAEYCSDTRLISYLRYGTPYTVAQCLFDNYNSLTECCQSGLKNDLINSEEYSCYDLTILDATQQICAIRETCDNQCNDLCYYDTNGNCANAISKYCLNYWEDNNTTGLLNCLQEFVDANEDELIGQCCDSIMGNEWDQTNGSCSIPQAYYYDPDNKVYNYELCTDEQIINAGCDSYDNPSNEQMLCLINNKTAIAEESCCRRVIDTSETKYIFTHDCQGDALYFFGGINSWDISYDSIVNSFETVIWDSIDEPTQLSYTCSQSLQYCHTDGTWPTSSIGDSVTIDCPLGYNGTRTRYCNTIGDNNKIASWDDEDDSQCSKLYCDAFTDDDGQEFEATQVGKTRFYYGELQNQCILKALTSMYKQRECKLNEETNEAYWGYQFEACRGYYPQWSYTETKSNAYCNTTTASLVEKYNVYEDYTEYDAQLDACQSKCNRDIDNCLGFIFNKIDETCDFYDACEPITYTLAERESIFGVNYTSGDVKWWYNILSLDQYAAQVCVSAARNQGVDGISTYDAWSREGIPLPECFNTSLYVYFVNPTGGTLYRDKVQFNDIEYLYDDESYRFADLEVITTYNSFTVRGVDDDTVAVELILDIRDRLSEWEKEDLYVIPGGLVFDLFSQYVGVEESLITNLLYVSIAVVVTGFAFLLNWWAVVIMLLCNAAMIVEVYGFVEWLGLRVNGVLVLNIVIAVGLTMEFTAHIGRAFVLTRATKFDHEKGISLPFSTDGQIRMKKMYREMFNPVTMGAITTFLGVLPISLAEFPYFRQYYFVLYVVIVLFGWLNGVIFQPIFLSLLPPEPFDEEPLSDDEEPLTKTVEEEQKQRTNNNNNNNTTDGNALIDTNDGNNIQNTNDAGDDRKTNE